jgi:hypothetical protein
MKYKGFFASFFSKKEDSFFSVNYPASSRPTGKFLITKARRHEGIHEDFSFVITSCLRAFVVDILWSGTASRGAMTTKSEIFVFLQVAA